jgi:mRNA interferase MazF
MIDMRRKEIWMVNLPVASGSIQGGRRPCVVVSNDMANTYSSVIHIVPLTTKEKKPLRTHVKVTRDSGLVMDSTAMAEQTMFINSKCLEAKIGEVDEKTMSKIETAIMVQFGFYDKIKKIITTSKERVSNICSMAS